jgi:hypothetical protein
VRAKRGKRPRKHVDIMMPWTCARVRMLLYESARVDKGPDEPELSAVLVTMVTNGSLTRIEIAAGDELL